jgi:hypothetical protein
VDAASAPLSDSLSAATVVGALEAASGLEVVLAASSELLQAAPMKRTAAMRVAIVRNFFMRTPVR